MQESERTISLNAILLMLSVLRGLLIDYRDGPERILAKQIDRFLNAMERSRR